MVVSTLIDIVKKSNVAKAVLIAVFRQTSHSQDSTQPKHRQCCGTWSPLNPTQIMWFQLAQPSQQMQLTESSSKPEGSSFWQVAQHSDSVAPVCFAYCFSPCAFDVFDLHCEVLPFLALAAFCNPFFLFS